MVAFKPPQPTVRVTENHPLSSGEGCESDDFDVVVAPLVLSRTGAPFQAVRGGVRGGRKPTTDGHDARIYEGLPTLTVHNLAATWLYNPNGVLKI